MLTLACGRTTDHQGRRLVATSRGHRPPHWCWLIWLLTALAFVLLPALACWAQGGPLESRVSGLCRLRIDGQPQCHGNGTCQRVVGWGSAVVIGRHSAGYWLALTAAHNYARIRPYATHQCDIRRAWRRIVASEEQPRPGVDLAVIGIDCQIADLRCPRLATRDLSAGDAITIAGYPEGQLQSVVLLGTASGPNVGQVNGPVVPGWSGGGVYNSAGELAGIIWGGEPTGECYWTPITEIRSILDEHRWTPAPPSQPAGPTQPATTTPQPPAQLAGCRNCDQRFAAIEGRLQALAAIEGRLQSLTALEGRLTTLEGTQRTTAELLLTLEQRLTAQLTAIERQPGPPGPAGPPGAGVDPAALESLRQDIEALQQRAYLDVVWTDSAGQPVSEVRRYRLGERIGLARAPVVTINPVAPRSGK